MKSEAFKQKLEHELIEYAVNAVYLAIVFAAFTVYRRLILASYDTAYTNYWVAQRTRCWALQARRTIPRVSSNSVTRCCARNAS